MIFQLNDMFKEWKTGDSFTIRQIFGVSIIVLIIMLFIKIYLRTVVSSFYKEIKEQSNDCKRLVEDGASEMTVQSWVSIYRNDLKNTEICFTNPNSIWN